MQLLKIDEDSLAQYLKNNEFVSIVDIQKEDLTQLIELAATQEEITMDECTEENDIPNPIAKTIYTQIYSTLSDLIANKELYLAQHREKIASIKQTYGI